MLNFDPDGQGAAPLYGHLQEEPRSRAGRALTLIAATPVLTGIQLAWRAVEAGNVPVLTEGPDAAGSALARCCRRLRGDVRSVAGRRALAADAMCRGRIDEIVLHFGPCATAVSSADFRLDDLTWAVGAMQLGLSLLRGDFGPPVRLAILAYRPRASRSDTDAVIPDMLRLLADSLLREPAGGASHAGERRAWPGDLEETVFRPVPLAQHGVFAAGA